jgi:uncharacterized protein YcfL
MIKKMFVLMLVLAAGCSVDESSKEVEQTNKASEVSGLSGGTSHGYSEEQGAYIFSSERGRLTFMLEGSEESPVVNPCIMMKNYPDPDKVVQLEVNGSLLIAGKDYGEEVITETDGTPTKVIRINHEAKSPVFFRIRSLKP